ncbi:MAG: hypothetical protein QNJ55_24900 [Xenococcus sp. MO_188.B8]|nr:hypothetical protein [Xenococcus sp. MO_188.B8]
MLTKFRNLYPQGSILSELIDIDRGIYIVRVSIQIDGITLATGLAGATEVEQAEDNARNRALQALVLEDGHLSLNLATKAAQKVTTVAQKIVTASAQTNNYQNFAKTNPPTTTVSTEEKVTATPKPPISHPPLQSQSQGSLLSEPSVKVQNSPQPEPKALADSPEPETPISAPVPEYTEDFLEPPLEIPPPEEDSMSEEPAATKPPVEFDFNQIRHKIDLEMKRLSWTKEQGRDYLLSTYGKRSRLHLTDDELLEFWHYLETLTS